MRKLRRLYKRQCKKADKAPVAGVKTGGGLGKFALSKTVTTGAAVAIAVGSALAVSRTIQAYPPDNHLLAVANDADADFLSNDEELLLSYNPSNPDQNFNEIPDGVELAQHCADIIKE